MYQKIIYEKVFSNSLRMLLDPAKHPLKGRKQKHINPRMSTEFSLISIQNMKHATSESALEKFEESEAEQLSIIKLKMALL